jgi:hypothetical protein
MPQDVSPFAVTVRDYDEAIAFYRRTPSEADARRSTARSCVARFLLRGRRRRREIMATILVHADARADVRHAVELRCNAVREKDSKLVTLHAVDLSPDGMRVEVLDPDVEVGDRFFVCFQARAGRSWFYSDVFVVRILRGQRPGATSLGLRFGALSAASRVRIRRELRSVAPPLPEHEPGIDYAATVGRILAA